MIPITTRVNGTQTIFATNGFLRNPSDLVVAPDGSLNVAEASADVVVRIHPQTSQQTLLHSGKPGPRSPCVFNPRASLISQHAPGNRMIVRWTDSCDIWQLQTTTTPTVPNSWIDSNLTPTIDGADCKVSVPVSPGNLFFRLRR